MIIITINGFYFNDIFNYEDHTYIVR